MDRRTHPPADHIYRLGDATRFSIVNREHAAERSDGWDVLRAPGRETNLHRLTRSEVFTARTRAGRAQYDLHGRNLQPRPGTPPPATTHIDWHNREVFRGNPLIA
jgi:hypothetical protein